MKGTSLELQINSIQKKINEKFERFSKKKDREEFARYIGKFYVKELPNKDVYMGRNTFCGRRLNNIKIGVVIWLFQFFFILLQKRNDYGKRYI